MKKTRRQKRKESRATRVAKQLEENSKNIVLPITVVSPTGESSSKNEPDNDTPSKAVQNKQNNRPTRKAYRMSVFLSVVILAVVGILAGVSIAHWQKGNLWDAMWWGIAAYVLFGVGAAFTYYHSVIVPAQQTATEIHQNPVEELLRIAERPSVNVKAITLVKLIVGEQAEIAVTLENTGRIAAREVIAVASAGFADDISSMGNCPEPEIKNLIENMIGSKSKATMGVNGIKYLHAYSKNSMSAADIKGVKDGKKWLLIYGRAVFGSDRADAKYFTNFYSVYNPRIGRFDTCSTYNDSN